MRDVRELRRIVETMDNGSQKAFAEKEAVFNAEDTMEPQVADTVCEIGDVKPSSQTKDIVDIMCGFYG